MNTGPDAATVYAGMEIATAELCITAPVNTIEEKSFKDLEKESTMSTDKLKRFVEELRSKITKEERE